MEPEVLFSQSFMAGESRYAFEVRQVEDGTRVLRVTQNRQTNAAALPTGTILVPAEEMIQFRRAMRAALQFLGARVESSIQAGSAKAYDVSDIRKTYARAYEKWTPEEDADLRQQFQAGVKVKELAAKFQREPGAIQSRLTKLGLQNRPTA